MTGVCWLLQAQPILSIASAGEELKLSVPTVTSELKRAAKLDIARATTGRNYGRVSNLLATENRNRESPCVKSE